MCDPVKMTYKILGELLTEMGKGWDSHAKLLACNILLLYIFTAEALWDHSLFCPSFLLAFPLTCVGTFHTQLPPAHPLARPVFFTAFNCFVLELTWL